MELEPPTSAWEPLGSQKPMFEPPDTRQAEACPCGEEPIDTPFGEHIVGPQCRAQIERDVRHRFGRHRFKGRFSQAVEDVVQECYVKLVRPGGLDSFRPPPDRPRADAFRAWLSGVVRNHCNNKQEYWELRPDLHREELDRLPAAVETRARPPAPLHAKTPEQAFMRQCVFELADGAVADVEPRWREKGADGSERFDVFLPFVLELDDDYERAQRRLDIKYDHARQLKWKLGNEIRQAARARARDDLFLEPGLSAAAIEAKIDEYLEDLLRAAFPDEIRPLGFFEVEPEPEPNANLQRDDAPSESKP